MHVKRDRFDSFLGFVFFAAVMLAMGIAAAKVGGASDVQPTRIMLM